MARWLQYVRCCIRRSLQHEIRILGFLVWLDIRLRKKGSVLHCVACPKCRTECDYEMTMSGMSIASFTHVSNVAYSTLYSCKILQNALRMQSKESTMAR